MKLPDNKTKISRTIYTGQKDDEGRPHGHGIMEYVATTSKKFRYKGHFVHGVRSGYGVWYELSQYIREYEEWEWVQMGEYDSCGRLIHPNTKPGPRKEVVESWNQTFWGWWRNDDAAHKFDYTRRKYAADNLELTEDNKFLTYFHDFKAIRKLPKSMVSKLERSTKPCARYGYGVWLWTTHKDSESLKTSFKIFEESARAGIADALQLLSRMYSLGEAYDVNTGKFVMDRKLSMELQAQAIEKGSITAKLRRNRDLYLGTAEFKADKEAAIAVAERESSAIFSESILWAEQLGWFYQLEGETEKAVNAYEKCIVNGYYVPIFDLALIALDEDDFEYYKTLMEIGMKLEIPECYALGFEQESCWDSLDNLEKTTIHVRLKRNLPEGVSLGSAFCAYVMADALLNGKFGFEIDLVKGKEYVDIALTYGYSDAASLLIEAAETLQDPEFMSDEELLRLRYDALRYGIDEQLDYVIKNKDTYIAMGYGDEIR